MNKTQDIEKKYNVYTFDIKGIENVKLVKSDVDLNKAEGFDMDFTMRNSKRMSTMCEVGSEEDLMFIDELNKP